MDLSESFEARSLQSITVSEFINVLAEWENISLDKAFGYFEQLVTVYRLNLATHNKVGETYKESDFYVAMENIAPALVYARYHHDVMHKEARVYIPFSELARETHKAFKSIRSKLGKEKQKEFDRINIFKEHVPLGELLVFKSEAYKVFKKLGISEPYPWKYPSWIFDQKKYHEERLERKLTEGEYVKMLLSGEFEYVPDSEDENIEQEYTFTNKERENLLRTIRSLSMLLIDKSGVKFGSKENPNYSQLAKAIRQELHNNDLPEEGQSKSTLSEKIKEAFKLD